MTTIILAIFFLILFHYEFSVVYYFKKLMKLDHLKYYKLLDCVPCLSFWLSIPFIIIEPLTPFVIYILFYTYETFRN